MAFFEFPQTRTYDGDLGYIIKTLNELVKKYNTFFEYNTIHFADPIEWDITSQYAAFTIVFDVDNGSSFISKQPVPAGITLDNQDYWSFVGPLIVDGEARMEIERMLKFIVDIYETTSTATALRAAGDYMIIQGELYKATQAINIGENYTEGYNVEKITVEDMIHEIIASFTDSTLNTGSDNPIANRPVAIKFNQIDASIVNLSNIIATAQHDIDAINTVIAGISSAISSMQNDIATERAARESADQTLSSRIDAIANLPSGSTSGDAELIDIRTGAQGVVFPNAGTAVRTQAGNAYRALLNLGYRPIDFKDGAYYPTAGTVPTSPTAASGWRCAKINCVPGNKFIINADGVSNPAAYCFVNASNTPIQAAPNYNCTNLEIIAPANAAYIVINDHTYSGYCWQGEAPQIAERIDGIGTNFTNALIGRLKANVNTNLYDYHNVKVGHIQPSNGSINTNVANDYHYTVNYAPVTPGDVLYSNYPTIYAFYNSSFGWIGGGSAVNNLYTVPAGAAYVRMAANAPDQSKVIVNKGGALDPSAKPFQLVIDGITDRPTEIVDINGKGQYTSLTAALRHSTADLVVYPGTYNIVNEYLAEFGASIFSQISDSYYTIGYFRYGLYMENRKITFCPGAVVTCDLTGVLTVDSTHRFSPFNLGPNSVIEGLFCTCTGCWYLIHDDYGDESRYVNIMKDCVLIMNNPVNGNVIGGGTRSESTCIVDGCYLDNGLTPDTETMRYHNYDRPNASPTIIVKNTRANASIGARYYGPQATPKMNFIAHNNSTGSGVVKRQESISYNVDNVNLITWANVIE